MRSRRVGCATRFPPRPPASSEALYLAVFTRISIDVLPSARFWKECTSSSEFHEVSARSAEVTGSRCIAVLLLFERLVPL